MKKIDKKVSVPALVLIGLVLVFYNNVVAFSTSIFGLVEWQIRILILILVVVLVYYKTPWIKTIMRG